MAPAFLSRVNYFNYPIDNGIKFNNKPLLGKNKTYRGVIGGIIFSIIVSYIQYILYINNIFREINLVNYDLINPLFLGLLMGFGAIMGDLFESLIKRQLNFKPGESFYFFDQTDWVIGTIIVSIPFFNLNIIFISLSMIMFFLLHILIKHLGYYLKLEKSKW